MPQPSHVPCAGAVVVDDAGRLLLIRRGQPPAEGTWSLPGGRCEPGESPQDACVREVAEETGLAVEVVRWVGRVERDAPDGRVYDIDDYLCRPTGGTLRADTDVTDARWVDRAAFDELTLAPLLAETLAGWSLLPATSSRGEPA
ncbi:NUDIX hydrolase [Jatrophihabitans fulvus]